MCIAVISDLCDDVVKYVRGGDTDITFGRLVFFSDAESNSHRRDYWLDWPCQRLTILRVSRSKLTERNSIRTQSNWRLRSNLSSPPSLFVVLLLIAFLFIYLFFSSFLFLPTVLFYPSCPLFSFVLDEIFNSEKRKRKEKMKKSATQRRPFFCGRAW